MAENLNNYELIRKKFENFKQLKKELGLRESKIINVKQMEDNLKRPKIIEIKKMEFDFKELKKKET